MSDLNSQIRRYYDLGNEDNRLRAGPGRLELWRTQHILRRWLPPVPATVLDVGGGSGVHAEWLAADGYDVTLIDPVPLHVEQASAIAGVKAQLGDARSLSLPDASADVVLLLGPLYHLPERSERIQAIQEAMRVARPGALIAAAAISRFSVVHDSLVKTWMDDDSWADAVTRTIATGTHTNDEARPGRFTTAYFHLPHDLHDEFADAGLPDTDVLPVEGVGSLMANVDDLLDVPNRREVLMRWVELMEREPSSVGATGHLLALAHSAA